MSRQAPLRPASNPWASPAALGMALIALSLASSCALADQDVRNGNGGTLTASARLDFAITINKFLFFRVGTGGFPTASSTIDTVAFNLSASIPATGVTPVAGNSTAVNWSGALPTFTAGTSALPVEVHANAGAISIQASPTTPLTSGAHTLPMSSIVVTSSDTNFPAPPIPNAGTGVAVAVTGTAFSNLVTHRNAQWTFAYNGTNTPYAGAYTGQVTFTASAP